MRVHPWSFAAILRASPVWILLGAKGLEPLRDSSAWTLTKERQCSLARASTFRNAVIHNYMNIFAVAAFACLFALLVIQPLSPRLNPVSQA